MAYSNYEPGSLYFYRPNLGAAIAITVLSFLLGTALTIRTIHSQSWRFTIPALICAFELVAGFSLRTVGHYQYKSVGLFIAEEVCIQIAPAVMALALYLTLGRTLYYIPWLSPIHPGRVRTTFVAVDCAVGAIMGSGAARFGNTALSPSQIAVGTALLKAGMLLQCVLVVAFLALSSVFFRRCYKHGVLRRVKRIAICLYGCGVCILVRTIFRTIENFQGYLGEAYTHEAFFYCCDTLFVILSLAFFLVAFPGDMLPKSQTTYLALDGKTEREGPGWDDQRMWLLTLLDPFDIAGMLKGGDAKSRFWEEDDSGQAKPVVEGIAT